ncbi:hypothetical protein R3P38DRAFT_2507494, partial [Favolaschia claudopus]
MARSGKQASAHASRHPTRPIQQPRKRLSQASKASRALATAHRLQQQIVFDHDVDEWFEEKEEKIRDLAREHNKTVAHVRKVLSSGVRYSAKRAPSLWNAVNHDRSLKAKEEGGSSALKDIVQETAREEYERLKNELTGEEQKALVAKLTADRAVKKRGVRATNKSAAMDSMQTANRVGDVGIDLFERTGTRFISMFSRGHPDDPSYPYIVDSDNSRRFFKEVMKQSYSDVVRKFEQWSCTQDTDEGEKNDLDSVRKQITKLVRDGLRSAKNDNTLEMEWANYELDIVHKLGVELAGWPTKTIPLGRPSKLSADQARVIRDKLRSGAIVWVPLTREQRAELAADLEERREAGELPRQPRKPRADKGKSRGPRTKKKNNADDDDESDDEANGDGNEIGSAAARQQRSEVPAPSFTSFSTATSSAASAAASDASTAASAAAFTAAPAAFSSAGAGAATPSTTA